jgi:hypothetical protein
MSADGIARRSWIAAIVVLHLVISIFHGAAHDGAHVPLSPAATLFVFVVILAGPIAGAGVMWRHAVIGSWVVAVTLAGSLVFGVVNHFILSSPDHVAQVARQWQSMFATTAVLLALTEALGAGLAIAAVRERIYA